MVEGESLLDIDMTVIISDLDEISDATNIQLDIEEEGLERLDKMLKAKVQSEVNKMIRHIKDDDPQKDYLAVAIIDVADYGHDEPKGKWWFHLIDKDAVRIALESRGRGE